MSLEKKMQQIFWFGHFFYYNHLKATFVPLARELQISMLQKAMGWA